MTHRTRLIAAFAAVICAPHLAAQAPQTGAAAPAPSPLSQLAAGWAALGAGRPGDAEAAAAALLRARRIRHGATDLQIRARLSGGGVNAALDAYDAWMGGAGREDIFLVQPIARAVLDGLSGSHDLALKIAALESLAANGDADAAATLVGLAASRSSAAGADEALARTGNPQAIARLRGRVENAGAAVDVSGAIEALAAAKDASAAAAIARALDPSRPVTTRIAAARALGELDARDVIADLRKALQDPDPPVRYVAAAALGRMGDPSAAPFLAQLQNSPAGDMRMMEAEIEAPGSPSGSWVTVATAVLKDADPLSRLNAARLLLTYAADTQPARAALYEAIADPNPALRAAAARVLEQVPPAVLGTDLAQMRRLLRDSSPQVRIAAAGALLRQAGGVD